MSDSTSPAAAPENRLSVTVNGDKVDLLMSFGLLDKLLKIFTDFKPAENAAFDSDQRVEVIRTSLKRRGECGYTGFTGSRDYDPDVDSISMKDVNAIFAWVLDHVTDFFLSQGETAKAVMEKYASRTNQNSSEPSEDGSSA